MWNKLLIGAVVCLVATFGFGGPNSDDLLSSARQKLDAGDTAGALSDADKAVAADPENARCHLTRAMVRDARREFDKAVDDYSRVIKLLPKSAEVYQSRGEDEFRLGRFKESVADFDKVIELKPQDAPYHWQRGISLYYAGEFDRGVKQFELHKTVNPNDVENAVWHFLCVARLRGVAEARKVLIPISGDERIPMKQVHDLFAGTGTTQAILDASGDPNEKPSKRNLFYAYLYLGLYCEASGDAAGARKNILLAETYAGNDYMGDVARVHAALLKKADAAK